MALLRFLHAYKTAGSALVGDQLPDYLSVVCEFAARGDMAAGLALLTEHRAGLELIWLDLGEADVPYADALDIIRAVQPDLAPGDLDGRGNSPAPVPPPRRSGSNRSPRPSTWEPPADACLDLLLWVVVPYLSIAVFIGGHIWRYRYDKFGWTTRSSQLYEKRLLRLGSPLFHFGILGVLAGHVGGLLVPSSWTAAAGLPDSVYHALSLGLGTVAGLATVLGLAILIYRRRTVGPVFSATTRNDKAMYVVLGATILAGLLTTMLTNLLGHPHDYRETVARGSARCSPCNRTPP